MKLKYPSLRKSAVLGSLTGLLGGCNFNLGGDMGGGGVVTFIMVFAEILKTCWLVILLTVLFLFFLGLTLWITLRKK